ncbi:MAG: PVC-type heme-binding CxxCH protein, partial [Verrucomicrobiota bacterium]
MKNFLFLLVACPLALSAAEFKIGSHTFTLPEGFEVEQVAGPPLVNRPIEADFDELGRLYVTDSSGSNDKPEKQLQDKPHRIVRLEDTDGDGRFDKSQVFADKMMFPEGCMWFDGSLYVAAPPSIWKLTDTDGDGVADKREEWFQGKTLTGCANDLHGPYLGPDGRIYWCKGAFAKQSYTLPNGKTFNTRAAHIFRARPDGTGIEPVLTGGMDNPVGVAFTPTGERILGGTFFQRPGGGKRDGLIHAVYGGVYGKDHDVVYEHKLTGDLMPIMTHHGPSATASITRYRANVFGPEHQDNIFACLFNLHKITRHVLEPEGATYRTIDSDFLVSDNTDFHPTDVFEDADGSLLVIDTGGWYKLCCPTSQLYKPDVLGAIYRVRKKGAQKIADPRGLQMNWRGMEVTDLARLLGDPRHTVRDRAIHTLAKRGITSVPELIQVLKKSKSVEARRNAVWALTRIPSEAARAGVRRALDDPDESVRHCALHSISAWRDAVYYDTLVEILEQGSPALKRIAAEAIGRIGIVRGRKDPIHHLYNVPLNDRVLEHSQIFALIELGSTRLVNVFAPPETRPPPASPLERRYGTPVGPRDTLPAAHKRAILIAVDQMDHSRLNPEHVIPILTNKDASLKQTAWWVIGHRPQWGGALAEFFKDRLTQPEFSESDAAEMENQLARLAG